MRVGAVKAAAALASLVAAARFLHGLRSCGTVLERGVRLAYLRGGTPHEWSNLLRVLYAAECAAADSEVNELFNYDGQPRPARTDQAQGWPSLARTGGGTRQERKPPRRRVRVRLDS